MLRLDPRSRTGATGQMGYYIRVLGVFYYASVQEMLRALRRYQPDRLSEEFVWRGSDGEYRDRPAVDFHPAAPSVYVPRPWSRKFGITPLVANAAAACYLMHADNVGTLTVGSATDSWRIEADEWTRLKGYLQPDGPGGLSEYGSPAELRHLPHEPMQPARVEGVLGARQAFMNEYSDLVAAAAGRVPHRVNPASLGCEPLVSYEQYRRIEAARPDDDAEQETLARWSGDERDAQPAWWRRLDDRLQRKLERRRPTTIPDLACLFPPDFATVL